MFHSTSFSLSPTLSLIFSLPLISASPSLYVCAWGVSHPAFSSFVSFPSSGIQALILVSYF